MPAAEHVLDFSQSPARLRLDTSRIIVQREGEPDAAVPLCEVAVVILAHPQLSITKPLLAQLASSGIAVIVADDNQRACGMMLPLEANTLMVPRIRAQISAKKPLNKRLWQRIVRVKIQSQAATLREVRANDAGLRMLAATVRSGDPENVEATAAQRYWPLLFADPQFRRRHDLDDQNRLLNYGYTVLRAAVGRAVCAAGLHPSIGIHHHGRNNTFCLADDLMEPYRPLIDGIVVELVGLYGAAAPLDREAKERLTGALIGRIRHGDESRSLLEHIQSTCTSLAQVYLGEAAEIFYPDGLTHGGKAAGT